MATLVQARRIVPEAELAGVRAAGRRSSTPLSTRASEATGLDDRALALVGFSQGKVIVALCGVSAQSAGLLLHRRLHREGSLPNGWPKELVLVAHHSVFTAPTTHSPLSPRSRSGNRTQGADRHGQTGDLVGIGHSPMGGTRRGGLFLGEVINRTMP